MALVVSVVLLGVIAALAPSPATPATSTAADPTAVDATAAATTTPATAEREAADSTGPASTDHSTSRSPSTAIEPSTTTAPPAPGPDITTARGPPQAAAPATTPPTTNTPSTAAPTTAPPDTTAATTTAPTGAASATDGDLVSTLLAELRTEPERPGGYDRSLFPHWTTSNGCTTRNRVLIRDARGTATVDANCRVTAGEWFSPFDATRVTTPRSLDIDHLVPLAEAWRSGAHAWDTATRRRFANDLDDPRSLIAVTASSNRAKGDRDPADWLPTHTAYRCTYVGDWVAVKHRWGLAVDARERSAIERVLSGCGALRTSPTAPAAIPAPAPTPTPTTTAPSATTAPSTTTTPPVTATPAPTTTTTAPATTAPAGPCVNINTASATDLERIIHIGPSRAAAIIAQRPFTRVNDLRRVSGISDGRLADITNQGLACT